jgi:hypothetical protein
MAEVQNCIDSFAAFLHGRNMCVQLPVPYCAEVAAFVALHDPASVLAHQAPGM